MLSLIISLIQAEDLISLSGTKFMENDTRLKIGEFDGSKVFPPGGRKCNLINATEDSRVVIQLSEFEFILNSLKIIHYLKR